MKSVFISSTFKDMQAERDYLHEKIFPRLRRVIGEYGEDIQELDLRWGVDTMEMSEEESGHQVLRVCIDAIDRCRPFIVVLLGERYGWIPETSLVESLHDERVDRWYEREMSITNLEIRYGALNEDETLRRCVFCFRSPDVISRIDETHRPLYDAESPVHRGKLDALKDQIRAKKDAAILEYDAGWDETLGCITGLEEFGEALYETLSSMIREEFAGQTARTPMEQMKRNMARMKEQYLSTYVPRQQEEAVLLTRLGTYHRHFIGSRLKSVENSLFVYSRIYLLGEAGSGKSALMAAMARHLEEAGRDTVLYFAGGQGCRTVSTLKDFMIFRLEEILNIPHETDYASRDSRLSALSAKAADRDIYCLIDGLDQLYPDYDRMFFDILGLCPNLCYLMSALPDFPVLKVTDRFPDYYMVTEDEESRKSRILEELTIPMRTLGGMQRREIIQKTSAKRGKKLSQGIVELILQKTGTDNPLYLTMLLQRLFMMDQQEFEAAEALSPGMEGLYQYMESLLNEMPDAPEDMAVYLLDTTGKRFASDSFRTTLMLLAVSDYGLTERDLEGLFETAKIPFSLIQFQQIVSYLYDAFTVSENGKWMFGHRLFQEAVLQRMTEEDTAFVSEMLLARSEQDDHFFETEGYVYVLKAKHSAGTRVIAKAKEWTTFQEVRDLIGKLVAEDAGYSRYFKEITDQAQPDMAAEFWLGFNYYD
ncbi:MAG: DUF4062 domain-containing protein, partial [Lachnospiraceae bacterium]|nr:DUF4062 domain-containing protein [Lachnospiraceae bacterium]